jgi:multiple sugar transport system ATP-binding protein
MNFIKVRVDEVNGHEMRVANPALDPIVVSTRGRPIARDDTAILGVRLRYLHPTGDESGKLHGTSTLTERLGAETVVEVRLRDGEPLIAALSEDRIRDTGARIGFDPARAQLFPMEP